MKAPTHLVLAALLAAFPFAVAADDGDDSTALEGSIEIGGLITEVDDLPDKAAEFSTVEDGPVGKVKLSTFQDWGALDFKFKYMATDENEGHLNFDVKRMVRSHTTYIKFPHRLGHDPMTNLESTSTNGKVVQHTDFSPSQDYVMEYALFEDRTELQFPGFRPLTLAIEFREQQRKGHTQAFTTSHCDTCHVKSQAHARNQSTTDGTLEASVAWKSGLIRARVTDRQLREDNPDVTVTFDNNLHPELQTPVFDNRMQFDDDVGPVPADRKPEIDKSTTRLDFRWASKNGLAITANGVWATTENRGTGYEADYSGYVVTAAKRFGNDLRLRWRGKVYETENDDVYIEPIQRTTPAGPHAGLTYYDVYGLTFDQWRTSALDREGLESKLDASYRLGRKGGTLRGSWDYDVVDRETYEVLPGEKETTTNVLGLSYRVRPAKGLRFDAEYKVGDVKNAFTLIDGACSTLVSEQYPNPWNPETPQYYDFHDARIAETTASASSWNRATIALGWSFAGATLTGRYVWWDGDNTDGDLTDWSKERQTATVTLWSPGGANWDWYLGWAYQDMSLDAPACIPVFDG
ncbi:MAG TPA: GSU2204 family CXXCH-containing (seleno)protein [Methylomirabilota bacterium]|nr:GSU2204 family CXXCH-containing (seleno)protein [Methylomirabilota bacterium]